jgi:ferrous iron transport protein A
MPRFLSSIPVGTQTRVADVQGSDPVAVRLLEMGLTPGAAIRVVGEAPLGGPMEIEVRGYRLSVRRREAACVEVALS